MRAGSWARQSTYIVPAVLGFYNTVTAPQGKKLRTGAGEAVGVAAAAFGGYLMYDLGKGLGESWYDAVSDTLEGWAGLGF